MENEKKLLEIIDLYTFFDTKRGTVKAVNNVSYTVEEGKTLGVVGESGSGKSVSAMSILRLLDGNGYIAGGQILFNGVDLTKLPLSEMYKIRGNDISVIFQEPMTSLNPVFSIEQQLSHTFTCVFCCNTMLSEKIAGSVTFASAVREAIKTNTRKIENPRSFFMCL